MGGYWRQTGRLRGKEAAEATYVKENGMRHLGIRGQGRVKSVYSFPGSLAILGPSLVTCPSVSLALGTRRVD